MAIKTFFDQVQEETIIICSHDKKVELLSVLTSEKLFKPITFIHPREFIEHAYGKIEDQALYEASVFFDLKPSIVEPWLQYLHTIDETIDYQTQRLTQLKELKTLLLSKGLYKPGSLSFYKDKTIFVENHHNALLKEALKQVNYQALPLTNHNQTIDYYEHAYLDDEIAYTMVKIRALIQDGINPSSITLATDLTSTFPLIKHYLKTFDIPYQTNTTSALWSYPLTQRFYAELSTKKGDVYTAINEIINTMKPHAFDETTLKIMATLTTRLNAFVKYPYPVEDLLDVIKHTLKKSKLSLAKYTNALTLCTLSDLPNTHMPYLFITGGCEGALPSLPTNADFLNETEKNTINYPASQTIQALTKSNFLNVLKNYQTVTLSYAKQTSKKRYYESAFLSDIKTHFTVQTHEPIDQTNQPYVKAYDQYNAKRAYEKLLNYNESSPALKTLTPYFIDQFNTYDHRFTPLSKNTTKAVFGDTLHLSYTKLNTYFQCKFKYLMDYGLKVDKITNTLPIDLGNVTHYIVEHHLNNDTFDESIFEDVVKELTKNRHYTAREFHLLQLNFDQIKNALGVINAQRKQSDYTLKKAEQTITKPYPNALFNGKIDAVYQHESTEDIFLIDYKTGSATLNIQHAYYGFNVQLLYYALLMKHSEPEKRLTGFYEQSLIYKPKILQNDTNVVDAIKDHLKLNGYTINDENAAQAIDNDIEGGSFIKSMRTKNDGAFYKTVKTYDDEALDLWVQHLDSLIHESIQSILNGDFAINPKRTTKDVISCQYCTYKDICFKDDLDMVTIKEMNEETLTETIKKKGGNDHEVY